MEKKIEVHHAVRYVVRSAVGPNGQGLALQFTVFAPDGSTEVEWPSAFLPLAQAENLAQTMLSEIARLRRAVN